MTLMYALVFILLSGACLWALVLSDPKRNSRSKSRKVLASHWRKTLLWLSFSPLLILFFVAQYSALLVWLGAVTIMGWYYAVMPKRGG
jgi:uncharacterized membrane protein